MNYAIMCFAKHKAMKRFCGSTGLLDIYIIISWYFYLTKDEKK